MRVAGCCNAIATVSSFRKKKEKKPWQARLRGYSFPTGMNLGVARGGYLLITVLVISLAPRSLGRLQRMGRSPSKETGRFCRVPHTTFFTVIAELTFLLLRSVVLIRSSDYSRPAAWAGLPFNGKVGRPASSFCPAPQLRCQKKELKTSL